MANSRLGCYWSVMHRRPQDYDYFKALQPTVFKIMDGGANDYAWAKANLPNALVLARDWAMSEQHEDMLKYPAETGIRHAREWNEHQKRLGFDKAKTLILGINEPKVWEPGVPEALRVYTIALCGEAAKLGLRVGAMQLSVGWPNNTGPDTPPNWEPWRGVDTAIRACNGALITHEYWADSGPGENWGWWAGRTLKCPWQVPIVIGECGVDMFVKDTSVGQQNRGWVGHMPPERYAKELAEYTSRMSADSRFVGCCVFASDFAAHEWYSFDVEPAYHAILATPTTDTHTVFIPAAGSGTTTMYVTAPAGLYLRAEAKLDGASLGRVPYGEQVTALGDLEGQWVRVQHDDKTGYMYRTYLSATQPQPVTVPSEGPEPTPQPQDNWGRSIAFVRRWEGGWADDPNDPGGATNKGITFVTFTKWRITHGQPHPTKDDLRNISDEETNAIYRQWYWLDSGCEQMAWPLCLAVFDTSVNSGPGNAAHILNQSNGNFLRFMGLLIDWYARIDGFANYGRAWMRRRADLLLEAAK